VALRRWWSGRFGYRLAVELALVALLLALYRYGRFLAKDQTAEAFSNAREVLRFEDRLGIANEAALQRSLLDFRWLIMFLNRYYVSVHFPATVAFFAVAYVKAPRHYTRIRNLFVAVTAAALVIHVLYPLAPPRMLPGFVDTVSRFGPKVYDNPGVEGTVNQFAAMPSLHFGWSVLVAYGVVAVVGSRFRWLIVAHPVLILVSIVVTANHYWLDAVVAGGLVAAAVAAARSPVLFGGRRSVQPSMAAGSTAVLHGGAGGGEVLGVGRYETPAGAGNDSGVQVLDLGVAEADWPQGDPGAGTSIREPMSVGAPSSATRAVVEEASDG
jgi:hypothetical protein